jgi:hypothetical protein
MGRPIEVDAPHLITVRVTDAQRDALERRRRDAHTNMSAVVRAAIAAYVTQCAAGVR